MEDSIPVLITLRFTEEQLDRLRSVSPRLAIRQQSVHEDREDISPFLQGDEIVIYGMTAPRELARAPALKWVQLHSAGINQLQNSPIWFTNILVTNASGIHAVPISEFAVGMMLALSRKVPRMIRLQERAEWPRNRWEVLLGSELRGRTLGVVGYGSIGREIARIGKTAFGMHVVATRYSSDPARPRYSEPGIGDPEGLIPEHFFPREQLPQMLSACDYIVLALPLTRETRKLINEETLKACKPDAFLVNIARGDLVDEHALVRALKENRLAGAGLDAYSTEPLPRDSQLWHMENVIVSPHVSGATPNYDDRAVGLFAENLRRYVEGEPLLNIVSRELGY